MTKGASMNKIHGLIAATAFALAFPGAAFAHGFWFAQRANQFAMVFGVGADDLDMVKRLPKVTKFAAYDEDGKEVASKLVTSGPIVLVDIDNQPAIVAASMNYGMWSKTPDGKWFNKGKDEVPDAVISEQNYKYGVHLRRDLGKAVPLLPGQTLQIVPVPVKLPEKMGAALKLKVFYQGQPVAGARVLSDWVNDPDAKGVKTGKDGSVTIKVRNQGLNVIVAILETPPEDPAKTKTVEHLASLSFVLPHEPE
jgi:nickel transport protein